MDTVKPATRGHRKTGHHSRAAETARRARILTLRQLGRIMKGMHCPSLERATALAQVLGMPVEELFTIKVKTRVAE